MVSGFSSRLRTLIHSLAIFASCQVWTTDFEMICQLAQYIGSKYGINALDALHIASAIFVNADEFITTEKTTKPLHRVTETSVISITN